MDLEKTREIISDVATTETSPVFEAPVAAVAAAGVAAGAALAFLGTKTPRVIPSKIQPFCGIHESALVEAPQLWSFQVSGEDVEQQDGGLSPEELIFLKEFPMMKADLEAVIKKQRAIADDIDKTHKKFTQTKLVTDSIAVVSGTMNFMGLALAPVTVGGSLMLSAAGQGLGTVAGGTSLATSVLEYLHNKQAQAQVSLEVSDPDQKVKEAVNSIMEAGKTVYSVGKTIENIENNMRALELVKAKPLLAEAAENLLLTGQASARTTRIVKRAFRGTPLAMGTKDFLKHSALAGLFLGMDMRSLAKHWKQLKEGARTEEADQLRAQAEEWERKLAVLTQLYEHLQERSLRNSSSKEEEAGMILPQPPAKQGEAGPRATVRELRVAPNTHAPQEHVAGGTGGTGGTSGTDGKVAPAALAAQMTQVAPASQATQAAQKIQKAHMASATQAAQMAPATQVAKAAKAAQKAPAAQAAQTAKAAQAAPVAQMAQKAQKTPVAQKAQVAPAAPAAQKTQKAQKAQAAPAEQVAQAAQAAQQAQVAQKTQKAQKAQKAEKAQLAPAAQAAPAAPAAQMAQAAQAAKKAQAAQTAKAAPTAQMAQKAQAAQKAPVAQAAQKAQVAPMAQATQAAQAAPAAQKAPAAQMAQKAQAAQKAPAAQVVQATQKAQAAQKAQKAPAAPVAGALGARSGAGLMPGAKDRKMRERRSSETRLRCCLLAFLCCGCCKATANDDHQSAKSKFRKPFL